MLLDLAAPLAALQKAEPGASLGSYPWYQPPDGYGVHLVARSADESVLARAREGMLAIARDLGADGEVL